MKSVLKRIAIVAVIMAVTWIVGYFTAAFFCLSFNIFDWDMKARGSMVGACTIVGFIAGTIIAIEAE